MMGVANMRLYEYGQENMVNQTLKQEISQLEADFCSALSDPNRILMLYALSEKPLNVTELTQELGLNQSTTSRHSKLCASEDWYKPSALALQSPIILQIKDSFRLSTCCGA